MALKTRMKGNGTAFLIGELLGGAQLFVSAVSGVMEQTLLAEITGDQLTHPQLKILRLLDLTEARTIGDMAAFLGVSNAAASKAVDRLVRRNYVERAEGRADRRSSELSLAPAGRKLVRRYEAARRRRVAKIFGGIAATRLRQTAECLDRLTRRIVAGSAHPDEVCLQCGLHLKTRCVVREAVRAECAYQVRARKGQSKRHAQKTEVPTRSGAGVVPPG
jgi:DNA-binding MarR family transcriptional regulator